MNTKKNILITGATGIVGGAVIPALLQEKRSQQVIAAVRNFDKSKSLFSKYKDLGYRSFNMEKPETFPYALENITSVFLLRPPHISDVEKYFVPFIQECIQQGVQEIVFLSVQGVEKSKIIPHHKIEELIRQSGISYVFLRPSYFMQNLSTQHLEEIIQNNRIFVPAGKAIFNWVDVDDIGKVSAKVLSDFEDHKNCIYELTGDENLHFYEVADRLSDVLSRKISYVSPSLLRFYTYHRKKGKDKSYIFIMMLLHFAARFQKPPKISNHIERICNSKPNPLNHFLHEHEKLFVNS